MERLTVLLLLLMAGPAALPQTLTITTETLPEAQAGVYYEASMAATGGAPPYTWSYTGWQFPWYMGFSDDGRVFGTPKEGGTYSLPIKVRDSAGNEATKTVVLPVLPAPLRIVTEQLGTTGQGEFFSTMVYNEGGTSPKAYSIVAGPSGMSIATWVQGGSYFPDYVGYFSGRTLEAGTHQVTIQITDSSNPVQTATRVLELVVNPASPLSLDTRALQRAYVGLHYQDGFAIIGGAPLFTLQATGLPLGISADIVDDRTILLRGAPEQAGSFEAMITVEDALGSTASRSVLLQVAQPIDILTTELPDVYAGEPYSQTLQASGGTPPYYWSTNTSLPSGLILSESGTLSGTYTGSGGFLSGFWADVRDSTDPPITTQEFVSLMVRGERISIVTRALPLGAVGSEYPVQLKARGGSNAFDWFLTEGSLPAGLSLDRTTGRFLGVPTETGAFGFRVRVDDRTTPPDSAWRTFRLQVGASRGRNNTIQTATPLSNGRHRASISPLGELPGIVEPDVDVYAVRVPRGSVVRFEIYAERLFPKSPMDPVMEIVDANGVRHIRCLNHLGNPGAVCMNDDSGTGTLDSRLRLQLSGSGTETVYVRVLDWRGDARPDLRYEIEVEGAVAGSSERRPQPPGSRDSAQARQVK